MRRRDQLLHSTNIILVNSGGNSRQNVLGIPIRPQSVRQLLRLPNQSLPKGPRQMDITGKVARIARYRFIQLFFGFVGDIDFLAGLLLVGFKDLVEGL